MSQSLSILYTHATFGTKGRNPWINVEIAADLHAYMASIFKALDSPAVIINSMPDHIHILFRISKTVTIAEIIEGNAIILLVPTDREDTAHFL